MEIFRDQKVHSREKEKTLSLQASEEEMISLKTEPLGFSYSNSRRKDKYDKPMDLQGGF